MVIGPDARYGLSGITFPAEGGIIDGEIYMKTQIKKFGRRGFGGRLCSALVGLILPISAAAQMFQWPVTPNQLEYSNFVFVVTDYTTNPDGTRSYLPTDRMYELRLQDFAPQ